MPRPSRRPSKRPAARCPSSDWTAGLRPGVATQPALRGRLFHGQPLPAANKKALPKAGLWGGTIPGVCPRFDPGRAFPLLTRRNHNGRALGAGRGKGRRFKWHRHPGVAHGFAAVRSLSPRKGTTCRAITWPAAASGGGVLGWRSWLSRSLCRVVSGAWLLRYTWLSRRPS